MASSLGQPGNAILFGGQILLAFVGLWGLFIPIGWITYLIFLPELFKNKPFVPHKVIFWAMPVLNTLSYIIYLFQKVLEEDQLRWTQQLYVVLLRTFSVRSNFVGANFGRIRRRR